MNRSCLFLRRLATVLPVGLCAGVCPGQIQLNDTGVHRYSDDASFTVIESVDYPGQDSSYGRDAAAAMGRLQKQGDGAKGFDFTKLDSDGNPLPASASSWDCVRDNVTGLEWEVKTDDGGLRDKGWFYSWYSNDSGSNGGQPGYNVPTPPDYWSNPEVCGGTLTYCNTQEYAYAVNLAGLCHHFDWRLPTIEELGSIVDYGVAYREPTIDRAYFPDTDGFGFWSSSVSAADPYDAWLLSFGNGYSRALRKGYINHIRLVRARQ